MKRKSAERRDWHRVTKKRFAMTAVAEPDFEGTVTMIRLDEVVVPLWVELDQTVRLCVADNGYSWMQHFPSGSRSVLTTMTDEKGQVVQWYIDICKQHGLDDQGVPWFDDLYLDVVVLPTGKVFLLDSDELDEALQDGVITQDDHDLAWQEANRLLDGLKTGMLPLIRRAEADRQRFVFRSLT